MAVSEQVTQRLWWERPMTLEKLKDVMVHQLAGFKPKADRGSVDENTVFQDVLGSTTGPQDPATIYKQLVQMACKMLGTTLKPWPKDWVTKTTATLAPELLPDKSTSGGGG